MWERTRTNHRPNRLELRAFRAMANVGGRHGADALSATVTEQVIDLESNSLTRLIPSPILRSSHPLELCVHAHIHCGYAKAISTGPSPSLTMSAVRSRSSALESGIVRD